MAISAVLAGTERWHIETGHVLEVLGRMPDESVQMICTSPPYWGLRSYGHYQMQILWGAADDFQVSRKHPERWWLRIRWRAAERGNGVWSRNHESWIGALGLEPTIEMYVAHTVQVCRELWRVLRPDGTVWWNIADSYASGKGTCFNPGGGDSSLGKVRKEAGAHPLDRSSVSTLRVSGLKPKDLCLIPSRVALALQKDGWWVRSCIIWSKPNPMPESVRDRPSTSHEYVYLLTKSARYFYDADAVREPHKQSSIERGRYGWGGVIDDYSGGARTGSSFQKMARGEVRADVMCHPAGRNLRSVWEIATHSFSGAHFATFPPKLVERCILAGTSERGCCPECGKPWQRLVGKTRVDTRPGNYTKKGPLTETGARKDVERLMTRPITKTRTLGWRPGCSCFGEPEQIAWDVQRGLLEYEPIPCVILDPFSGASTTILVALRLGRRALGIELSESYVEMSTKRIRADARAMSRRMM